MTTHKENALELIGEVRGRLETPAEISTVGMVIIRGLLAEAASEIQQIDELKRPRRTRRMETAS